MNQPSQRNSTENPTFILRDIAITAEDIRKRLVKLKANKASGPDAISVNVLRNCPNLDLPFEILFNQSVQTSKIPQDWRDANISPTHKKSSRSKSSNYLPVSLTSQVAKLLECIIYHHLLDLATKNKTISCHQHGFQNQCSCITQLLECLCDWTQEYDEGSQTDIIYLDFAKAFDTVPHKRLITKLKSYGIRGKVLSWIEAFLNNRRQRVVLRNGSSKWILVKSGVPQESILGPLLFLFYVNDMPTLVQNTAKMFADDTKLYAKTKTRQDCDRLQQDLNHLAAWSQDWLLKFNETKCVVLKIRESLKYAYTLNGYNLKQETTQKDLGVAISDDLKPATHIQEIVKKANQRIGIIKRCFTGLTQTKVQTLYHAIVRPILEYGSPVWNPNLVKDINALEKVQDRCAKLTSPPLTLQKLSDRRWQVDMCEVYKYVHNMYKSNPFFSLTQSHYQLRGHSLKLEKNSCRTTLRQLFFGNRVVNDWNRLPEDVVSASSLQSFKRKLRSLPSGEEG